MRTRDHRELRSLFGAATSKQWPLSLHTLSTRLRKRDLVAATARATSKRCTKRRDGEPVRSGACSGGYRWVDSGRSVLVRPPNSFKAPSKRIGDGCTTSKLGLNPAALDDALDVVDFRILRSSLVQNGNGSWFSVQRGFSQFLGGSRLGGRQIRTRALRVRLPLGTPLLEARSRVSRGEFRSRSTAVLRSPVCSDTSRGTRRGSRSIPRRTPSRLGRRTPTGAATPCRRESRAGGS